MSRKIPVYSAVTSITFLFAFGTWSFRMLEGWTWIQSFYFTVTTLTTVGYGDVIPSRDETRLFTAFFILIGVGVVLAAITTIGNKYLVIQEKELTDRISRRIKNDHK